MHLVLLEGIQDNELVFQPRVGNIGPIDAECIDYGVAYLGLLDVLDELALVYALDRTQPEVFRLGLLGVSDRSGMTIELVVDHSKKCY